MPRRRKLRILITAGPTREYIDSVRYISNDSSGKMGVALCRAALRRGHRVTLIHGPLGLTPPKAARAVAIVSAAEMLAACDAHWPRSDALIMAAAVADYTPLRRRATKLKKSASRLNLPLEPTVDILARLSAARSDKQVVVGFALEDRRARSNAARKLRDKRLDAIVLNSPGAIAADASAGEILTSDGCWASLARRPKSGLAIEVVRLVERLWSDRAGF